MIDWKKYRDQFPAKYWQSGMFEMMVPHLLPSYDNAKTLLDIGGGITGTECVKPFVSKYNIHTYFLDPFVEKPDWINEAVTWDNLPIVDVMVCRGAINYLTPEQLDLLNQHLTPNGVIFFNTFILPPLPEWNERSVVNFAGQTGVERYRLVGNIVEHQLEIGETKVDHTFFWYSLADFKTHFAFVNKSDYGINSILLVMGKRHEG